MGSERPKEWFNNQAFWRENYDVMFTPQRIADAAGQVAQLLELIQPPGIDVLDLCCGAGRCAIPLAKSGYTVTGVDCTAFMLDKARRQAAEEEVEIEWIEGDMRDFRRPDAFDLVINMFTSFGYFDDKRDDLLVLRNVLDSLKPGGSVVIDVLGKERLARELQPVTSSRLPDGAVFFERHEIYDEWTRIRNEWIVVRGRKARRFAFHHTIYSGQELRDRLELTGFVNVRLYGTFDGLPYGPDAPRLIAVGQKPA